MIGGRLPPFVYREKTRHGRFVYYLRRGRHGSRIRLPDFGTPEFEDAYSLALTGTKRHAKEPRGGSAGSLAWLIARYRENSDYLKLSAATRKQRDAIFYNVAKGSGHVAVASISRRHIMEGRETRAATPTQARHFLETMRGLFGWAYAAELVADDPTLGVKNPSAPKGDGFAAWTDDDVARFEAHWPAGTKERVWLHVLLYTGLRRGDAVLIGRQHVKNGVATIRAAKTDTEVCIRILPPLAETLAIGPTGDLAFIAGAEGKPLVKESFGNLFREACNAAGVKKSAHGLRKLAATRAAEAGATVNELEAMFGWSGGAMASLYTRKADRRRLASAGSVKVENVYRRSG